MMKKTGRRTTWWLAVLLISVTLRLALAATADENINVLLITKHLSPSRLYALVDFLKAHGHKVNYIVPPRIIQAKINTSQLSRLLQDNRILEIFPGPIDEACLKRDYGKNVLAAVRIWNQEISRSAEIESPPQDISELTAPSLERPDRKKEMTALAYPPWREPTERHPSENSKYLVGTAAVSVIFMKSAADVSDWDSAGKITTAMAEIQTGLNWLSNAVNSGTGCENPNVLWVFAPAQTLTTTYDPVTLNADTYWYARSAGLEILGNLGYEASLQGGDDYNWDLRSTYQTDMAFTIFVADCSGSFFQAFAYRGGPFHMVGYPTSPAMVTAHETGHIFEALDEYSSSNSTATSRGGYLNIINGNFEIGGIINETCLMKYNSQQLCRYTCGHMGLLIPDTVPDNTPDALQYEIGGVVREDQVQCLDYAIDDDNTGGTSGNNNHGLDAGETVGLSLELGNYTYVTMRGLTLSAQTLSPYLSFQNSQAYIGNLADKTCITTPGNTFTLSANNSLPAYTFIPITFTVKTSQGWQFHSFLELFTGPRVPYISQITPNLLTQSYYVNVKLAGANFASGAQVRLLRNGFSPISASYIFVESQKEIYLTFNLDQAASGHWDLEIINPDGSRGLAANALTIGNAPDPGIQNYINDKEILLAFPNPAVGDKVTFSYWLEEDAQVAINIFSVNGKIVSRIEAFRSGGGRRTTDWNISSLPQGIYFYQIQAGSKKFPTQKLAIIKK